MKNSGLIYFILFWLFAVSCDQEPEPESISLKWIPCEFSSYGSNFFAFRTGDDGNLYSIGFVDGRYGVHKAKSNTWETIAKLEWPLSVQDFAIFKGHAYLITSDGTKRSLWKAKDTNIEEIEYGSQIFEVESYNGRLVISGDFTEGMPGTSYGLAYSEDALEFIPIAPVEGKLTTPGFGIVVANNKLYVRSSGDHNVYEYDGIALTKTGYTLGYELIDAQSNFYSIGEISSGEDEIVKRTDGKIDRIGNLFNKEDDINSIFFLSDILVSTGINRIMNNSITFFFDGGEWRQVESSVNFFGTFKFDDRIFAYSIDGVIEELVFE